MQARESLNCLVDTVLAKDATAGDSERITGLLEVATVSAAQVTAGASERITELLEVDTVLATDATAGDSERITELLEVDTVLATDVTASDSERIHGLLEEPRLVGGAAKSHATAGESEEIIGLHVSPSSLDNSSNSRGCVAAVACARLPAVPSVSACVCPVSSSSAVSAAVAHARSTPMHDAHNSGGTGGLLPVQRSTSYCLGNSWSDTDRVTGPTGRRCTKGGVSGPAEDLRPVSEVEAGVNFRPAGGAGAGCRFHLQETTRHRNQARQGKCGHTFPPDTDWTSGNRWVGRRCVVLHDRGFGC